MSNRIALPPEEEMLEDVQAFYLLQEASDISKRFTHMMDNYQVKSAALVASVLLVYLEQYESY